MSVESRGESIAERSRRIKFGQFSRTRPDERLVELFLAWWGEGRFASNPCWLPQHVRNVEVIASDVAGSKLAIEHTAIHAFENHQREEKWIGQLGAELEGAAELHFPGRRFSIIFNRDVFDDLDEKKRGDYTQALKAWFAKKLPSLSMGIHHLEVPEGLLPGKKSSKVEIEVDGFLEGLRPVNVCARLPEDATKRAEPQVDKVLNEKLPKLSNSAADRKVLLVELPTIDTSPGQIIDLMKSSTNAAQLKRIDFVVVAKTLKDQATGSAWFFAYDTRSYELGEVGRVTW